jgi:hypothetical protein
VSVFCFRTGFLSFFFLIPLALGAFAGGPKTAWAGGIAAVTGNVIISLWAYLYQDINPVFLLWGGLYYTVMTLVFTWINAPLSRFWIFLDIPYRMAAGAVLSTLIMIAAFRFLIDDSQLQGLAAAQLAALNGLTGQEGGLTVEEFTATLVRIGLRGGIPASCMIFWWINRQIAAGIVRIARHSPPGGSILSFRIPPFLVWVFSAALGSVVLGRMADLEIVEISGWNILVVSGILFCVQGGAIVFYYLLKTSLFFRILANVGIIFLLFIPGAMMALLSLFLLLGIAENWVPFRTPK